MSPVSRDFKKTFLSNLIDEYPTSTIMQKDNSFLVYPSGVSDLKDPVKVDSTSKMGGSFTDTTYAWIMPTDTTSLDTNYYTLDSMRVEFTVIDPGGLVGRDTIPFFINPKNDPPVWSGLRDTVVFESDSISLDFASYLSEKMIRSTKSLVFVIGGAFGFSDPVYQRANTKISLSKMTFSHQMVRLIFKEQLYRAFTILKGEKYHHE